MRKMLAGTVIVIAGLFLLSAPNVLAQEPCNGNFDCDRDVDSTDVAEFLVHFGRSPFFNPCPLCQDSLCPCSSTVPKTGQTTSYATGDDGDLEKGLIWSNPRFTDNGDGTVTDNLTNLIWLKDANCSTFGAPEHWYDALNDSNGLSSGFCGLTDSSNAGDWRLPNLFELESLRDMEYYGPALPNTAGTGKWTEGDPFTNVQSNFYWSSTTHAGYTDGAWNVDMYDGFVFYDDKIYLLYVWPVRGGG